MPGGRRNSKPPSAPKSTRDPEPAASAPAPVQALKPRPVLFAVMCVMFAVWMAFLIALYFKTHPRPSLAQNTATSQLSG
jgi:hypothetical protein